jgi:hypothetical protein
MKGTSLLCFAAAVVGAFACSGGSGGGSDGGLTSDAASDLDSHSGADADPDIDRSDVSDDVDSTTDTRDDIDGGATDVAADPTNDVPGDADLGPDDALEDVGAPTLSYPLECESAWLPASIPDPDAVPSRRARTTEFALLSDRSVHGVYDFGVLSTYGPLLEAQFGLPEGRGKEILERRALRLFSDHGINTINTEGTALAEAAAQYGQRLIVSDDQLSYRSFVPDVDTVLARWLQSYVEVHADDERILAWQLFDEPRWTPELGRELTEFSMGLGEVDSLHPPTLVTNTGVPEFASLLDLYMGEVYDLYYVRYRGRGDFRASARSIRDTHEAARYANVYTLWGELAGGHVPSAVDARRMMFLTLAHGGTGWVWYRGRQQPPPWIGGEVVCQRSNECGIGACVRGRCEGALSYYGAVSLTSLSDHFDVVSPALREIGAQARELQPIAQLLQPGRVVDAHPVAVESCVIETLASVHPAATPSHELLQRPAVEVGVWDLGDAFAVVLANRDIRDRQVAALHVGEGRRIVDLHTLNDVVPSHEGPVLVDLPPGGGRVFLVGDDAARATAVIQGGRYQLDSQRARNAIERWEASGLVDLDPARASLALAAESIRADDPAGAVRHAQNALTSLTGALAASADASRIDVALRDAQESIRRISSWLKERAPLLARPLVDGAQVGGLTPIHPLGTGYPSLTPILDALRQTTASYYPLVLGLETGARSDPAGFEALAGALSGIEADFSRWRVVDGPNVSVGVLEIGSGDDQLSADSPWGLAQLAFPEATRLRLNPSGAIVDSADRPADVEVLWLHVGPGGGDAALDEEGRIRVPDVAVSPEAISAISRHLDGGGGLLLTGHASQYLRHLGLEEVAPGLVEVEAHSMLSQLDSVAGYTSHQRLGVLATRGMEGHPLFRGLGGEFWVAGESVVRERHRSSWRTPTVPAGARAILGGATTGISPPARDVDYDIVEYNSRGARILVLALPALDFSPRASGVPEFYGNGVRLVGNAVTYLAGREPLFEPGRASPLAPPARVDVANIDLNPGLTWSVSHADRGVGAEGNGVAQRWPGAPFDSIRGTHDRWESGETPASVTIDLGESFVIDQVALRVSFTTVVPIGLTHARVRVSATDPGDLTEVSPPARFQAEFPNQSFFGVNFRFEPVRARYIVLDELQAPEGLPVGLNDITVYGQAR